MATFDNCLVSADTWMRRLQQKKRLSEQAAEVYFRIENGAGPPFHAGGVIVVLEAGNYVEPTVYFGVDCEAESALWRHERNEVAGGGIFLSIERILTESSERETVVYHKIHGTVESVIVEDPRTSRWYFRFAGHGAVFGCEHSTVDGPASEGVAVGRTDIGNGTYGEVCVVTGEGAYATVY